MQTTPTPSRTPRTTPVPSRKPSTDPRGKPTPPKRSSSTPAPPRPKPSPPKRSATGNYSSHSTGSRDVKPKPKTSSPSSSPRPSHAPAKKPTRHSSTSSGSQQQVSRTHSSQRIQARQAPIAKSKAIPSSRPKTTTPPEREHKFLFFYYSFI